jgi:hypothetical protein
MVLTTAQHHVLNNVGQADAATKSARGVPARGTAGAKPSRGSTSNAKIRLKIVSNEDLHTRALLGISEADALIKIVAVAKILFEWRCFCLGRRNRQAAAAVLLQRRYRGWAARGDLLRTFAARAIQFNVRGYLHRVSVLRTQLLNVAVLTVQRRFIWRQSRRCKTLQDLAVAASDAFWQRQRRIEEAQAYERDRLHMDHERRRRELVQAALQQIDGALARKRQDESEQRELAEIKHRLRHEKAAVKLLRRCVLRKVMNRRMRAMMHQKRQKMLFEMSAALDMHMEQAAHKLGARTKVDLRSEVFMSCQSSCHASGYPNISAGRVGRGGHPESAAASPSKAAGGRWVGAEQPVRRRPFSAAATPSAARPGAGRGDSLMGKLSHRTDASRLPRHRGATGSAGHARGRAGERRPPPSGRVRLPSANKQQAPASPDYWTLEDRKLIYGRRGT